MHSFFKSRSSKKQPSPNPPLTDRIPVVHTTQLTLDELGRSSPQLTPNQFTPNLDQQPSFHSTSQFNQSDSELQLIYGYIGLYTEVELDLPTAARAANLVAQELKARALETPLLFSTHALDISTESTHSLIRAFVHNQHELPQHLTIHSPHNLAAFLKWILCRYVNGRGGHGFFQWEQYASWRESEKAFGYPPRFLSTHLLVHISAPAASLLSCLLDLFASASVRADLTGMTVHKCGALFGAYIFGLEDDKPFEQTYTHWLRQSHATEHLILAHMRDLKAQSPTGKLPLRMESSIQGYPSIIPSLIKTHPSARLERVARFQRLTSFYNKNLISSAGTWNVARSKTWDRLKPYPEIGAAQYLNHSKAGFSTEPSKLLCSPSYKHLLNIKGQLNPDNEDDDDLGANFEGPQRFKTLVEKEWSGFMNRGFQEPDAKKLQFNLQESSNAKMKMKRETMDWDSFTGAGFMGRETYNPTDLDFNANIQTIAPPRSTPPIPKKGISKKLIKTNKSHSVFSYDTTPIELPSLFVDENFFEAWADVLVSSGWCHDELKEVSWILIHCKCKPADYQEFEFRPTPLNPDGRNDDMWALFEEVIPAEYQAAQLNAQKVANHKNNRRSFLRVITRKDNKKSGNGSSSDRGASTSQSSLNYYPIAPQSHAPAMSNSTSQSSSNYQADSSSEYSTSRAASTTPQSGHVGLFRSLSKMIQGSHSLGNINNIRHPAHLHTMNLDAEIVDTLNPSQFQNPAANQPEPWVRLNVDQTPTRSTHRPVLRSVVSSDTTRGSGTSIRLHGSKSQPFDRPANPTPPPSDRRRSSSSNSSRDFAPSTDYEGLVHDGSHSSAITRSIASSSDFTVELVERLPERASHLRPPSLIPVKSIHPANSARKPPPLILPSDSIHTENPVYNPSNRSLMSRAEATQPSATHVPTPRTPSSATSTVHSETSSPSIDKLAYNHNNVQQKRQDEQIPEQARLEQHKLLQQQQRQRLEQRRHQQQGTKQQQQLLEESSRAKKEQQPLVQGPRPTPQQEPYHQPEKSYLRVEPHHQEKPPHQLLQKHKAALQPVQSHLDSRFSPQSLKSVLQKVELHNSVSSVGSFESPGHRDDDWQLSLRKSVTPLSPIIHNHNFSTGPVLPPQFDMKAKKVSNIVDLFEKAQPESPPRDNDSYSISSYSMSEARSAASPIRIPVRSLKLSRVGEQDEK